MVVLPSLKIHSPCHFPEDNTSTCPMPASLPCPRAGSFYLVIVATILYRWCLCVCLNAKYFYNLINKTSKQLMDTSIRILNERINNDQSMIVAKSKISSIRDDLPYQHLEAMAGTMGMEC